MGETWTAPAVERREPDTVAPERAALEQWLDYHRDTLVWKCSGLTAEALKRRPVTPSTLSLLGLVRHMAEVERWWFRLHAAGQPVDMLYCTDADPNADFDDLDDADPAADLATFRSEVAAAREAASALDLDTTVACAGHGHSDAQRDVRWIYVHMIEEYARHNGHADLLREAIDGQTGE